MATITSAASGNFNATGTWVGSVVPVDNDSFIISTGHTVTYNVTTPVTTGFNDSDIYGILQSESATSTVLRMNGRLRIRTAGTYHARAGHTLQFRGTAASSHILYMVAETGSSLIMEGSDGMPTTTLSAAANERSTSFAFTSAANFAVDEWIAIYNNTTAQTANAGIETLRDEGFWIHDISGNTVYFRQFVGPTAIISSVAGSTITVQNSKVFRVGQKIIFGTGANRNIKTISSINYSTHVITCDSSITGTVTGLTVYETGSDKTHASGDKVRKAATVTTTTTVSGSSAITVANANMFVAGNDIWIEARSEAGSSTDYGYTGYGNETPGPRYKHTILSVSSNTLTLTAAVEYNVVLGALVTRLTRDVVVEPVTPNTDYYGVYVEPLTNYTQRLILKDVYFKYAGSSFGQPEGGIYINAGNYKTSGLAVTLTNQVPALNQQAWYEGVVMTGSNSTRDWGGFWIRGRYDQIRCSTVVGRFNSSYGLYYREGQCLYNSIAVGSDGWGPRIEGNSEWGEVAYVYCSRNFRGGRIYNYDSQLGIHHYINDATEYSISGVASTLRFYKQNHTGTRRGPVNDSTTSFNLIYSKHEFLSAYSENNLQIRFGLHSGHIDRGPNQSWFTSLEHNFEYDAIQQMTYLSLRNWDSTENSWRVYNTTDAADYGSGWFQSIFVPANVTLRARAYIKLAPAYSGNYPRFEIRDTTSGVGSNAMANAGGDWSSFVAGGAIATQFTAEASNNYEVKEITLSPVAFARYLNVGVHVDNINASEGYWLKPIEVFLDQPYANPAMAIVNNGPGLPLENYAVESSFAQNRVRIGGRIK
jgi:hypothetical protein